jgi:ankyrin repeat protein
LKTLTGSEVDSTSDEGSWDLSPKKERDKRYRRAARWTSKESERAYTGSLRTSASSASFTSSRLPATESNASAELNSNGLKALYKNSHKAGEAEQPLLAAIVNENPQEIRNMLQAQPASLWQRNSEGQNALHWAALKNMPKLGKYLLERAGNRAHILVNQPTTSGRTPMMLAARQGSVQTGQTFLTHNYPEGGVDLSKECFEAGGDQQGQRQTVLHMAAETRHPDFIHMTYRYAPQLSSDTLNKQDGLGTTALMEMAKNDQAVAVKATLKRDGVKALLRDRNGKDVTQHAAETGHRTKNRKTLNQVLLTKYRSYKANPAKRVKIALDAHDPRQTLSPLMNTVMNGEEGDVKRLLKFRTINVNQAGYIENGIAAKKGRARTQHAPITLAAEQGNLAAVKVLSRDRRTKRRIKTSQGNNAFYFAAKHGHPRVVRELLVPTTAVGRVKDFDIRKPNQYGETGIDAAVENGAVEVLETIQEITGETPRPSSKSMKKAKKKLAPERLEQVKAVVKKSSRFLR